MTPISGLPSSFTSQAPSVDTGFQTGNITERLGLSPSDGETFTGLVGKLSEELETVASDTTKPEQADKAKELKQELSGIFSQEAKVSKGGFLSKLSGFLCKVLSSLGCHKACYNVTAFLCGTLSFDERKELAQSCLRKANEFNPSPMASALYNLSSFLMPVDRGASHPKISSEAYMEEFSKLFQEDFEYGQEKHAKFAETITDDLFRQHLGEDGQQADPGPIKLGQDLPFEKDAFRTLGTTIEIEGQAPITLDRSDKETSKKQLLSAISEGFGEKRAQVLKNFLLAYNGQRIGQCAYEAMGRKALGQEGMRSMPVWDHNVTEKVTIKKDGSITYRVEGLQMGFLPLMDMADTMSNHKADAGFVIELNFTPDGKYTINQEGSHMDCTVFRDLVPMLGVEQQ